METSNDPDGAWYLFLHQVPPAPAYFRARVLRQLNQLGALAIKKSAYVLPANEESFEDLQWLRQSILSEGGEAWIFRADAVSGHSNEALREDFLRQRGSEYAALAVDARAVLESLRNYESRVVAAGEAGDPADVGTEARTRKLRRRFDAIRKTDYFGAPEQAEVIALMQEIERRQSIDASTGGERDKASEFHGRRWVTRHGIKVDRMASAWLIRRFVDPSPEFKFVDPATYRHSPRELRFDMFEGEFTHEGSKCTFEVLMERMSLGGPALDAIGEIIHDIDLKEPNWRRPETAGIATVLDGIVARHASDEARVAAGLELFDALYASLGGAVALRQPPGR